MTEQKQFEIIKSMADSTHKVDRLLQFRFQLEIGTDFYKVVNAEYRRVCDVLNAKQLEGSH